MEECPFLSHSSHRGILSSQAHDSEAQVQAPPPTGVQDTYCRHFSTSVIIPVCFGPILSNWKTFLPTKFNCILYFLHLLLLRKHSANILQPTVTRQHLGLDSDLGFC